MGTSNYSVAHNWAHQSGKCCSGSNFFYEGDTIYSYGHHFPVAKLVEVKGETIVLFNSDSYSIRTSKHQNYARRAASHLKRFTVPDVEASRPDSHEDNVGWLLEQSVSELQKAKRARKYTDKHLSCARGYYDEAEEYHRTFLPRRKWRHSFESVSEELLAKAERERKAREKAERKRRREAEEMAREYLKDWLTDPTMWTIWGSGMHLIPVEMRMGGRDWEGQDVKDMVVETSHGARVPLHDALYLYELCCKCRERGRGMDSFSRKVGSFAPSSIDGDGNATVGCHDIRFEAMERLYVELKGKGIVERVNEQLKVEAMPEGEDQ